MKFQDRLEKQEACSESLNWLKENKFKSKQAAWDACPRADWMLWAWSHNVVQDSKNHKQLVLAYCACARTSVKYIKDKKLKKLVEKCLETTEGWARDESATLEEVKNAYAAAAAAYYAANAAAADADAYAADADADDADADAYAAAAARAAYYAATAASAASDASFDAADAAYYAADAATAASARKAALKEMADIVRTLQPKCPKFLKDA